MSILTTPHRHRLVTTYISIGVAYAVIMYLVTFFLGETVANFIGPFLTTLFLAPILTDSPNVAKKLVEVDPSIKQDTPVVATNNAGIWHFFTLILAIFGLQVILGFVAVAIMAWFDLTDNIVEAFMSEDGENTTTFNMFLTGMVALTCIAYLVGGILCGKTAGSDQYRIAAFASLAVVFIGLIPFIVPLSDMEHGLFATTPVGLFAILYVAMALVGTNLGSKRSLNLNYTSVLAQISKKIKPRWLSSILFWFSGQGQDE